MKIPETLRLRINPSGNAINPGAQKSNDDTSSFVLYLPTVVLRKKHNPAFALACRLANHYQVPLIVLAVVLDDAHMPSHSPASPIVMTSRRLAFVLEALKDATQEWEQHGAGVAIRVHGPHSRTPHHLTLARHAMATITDEPFVQPYLPFCQSVERAAQSAGVPCYRVDGSTTVPPVSKLRRKCDAHGNTVGYKGVPAKAWMWKKTTESQRKTHVYGAVKDKDLDAPELSVKLAPGFFLCLERDDGLRQYLPAEWGMVENVAPGRCPWTVEELCSVNNLKDWALSWPGADDTVPPCQQTNGFSSDGQQRWNNFRRKHLSTYAKLRNQIQNPHAVSRMSCYLNLGIVSIFQVIYDLWQAESTVGAEKFEDEIVKWREMSYAHAFSAPHSYSGEASAPEWSRSYLSQCRQGQGANQSQYSLKQVEAGQTECDKWNGMQRYLCKTGELHNNARMTWGKTLVHWRKNQFTVNEILRELVYLNDRYALDGLAPPSYAGLLWCLGWCDKPKAGVLSEKPSSHYRFGPADFAEAERVLLSSEKQNQRNIADMFRPEKRQRKTEESQEEAPKAAATAHQTTTNNTLFHYFTSQSTPKQADKPARRILGSG